MAGSSSETGLGAELLAQRADLLAKGRNLAFQALDPAFEAIGRLRDGWAGLLGRLGWPGCLPGGLGLLAGPQEVL